MRSSRGEIKVFEILSAAGVNFQEEYSFPDLVATSGRVLRFDFAVFDDFGNVDFLIEVQGEQHYEAKSKFGGSQGFLQQKYNDAQKLQYCQKNGYKLICIPYWELGLVDYDYIFNAAYN